MINKLDSIFFKDVASKVKKIIRVCFYVLFFILIIAWVITFIGLIAYSITNLRWTILPLIGTIVCMPIALLLVIFVLWLSVTTLYMFCDLVENSDKMANKEEKTTSNIEETTNSSDALKF